MKTSTLSILRLSASGLCLVLFAGCMTSTKDDSMGALPTVSWDGKTMDSLKYVSALSFTNGQLIVANQSPTDPGVAVIDTSTGMISEYYSEVLPPSSLALTTDNRVIITETDYTQGAVSILHLGAKLIEKTFMSFGSDNTSAAADGKVFLFNRTTGVITGFTGHKPNADITLNAQTGAGSNPYGIAVSNGKAFVPRYNSKYLLILDATKLDGGVRDSIDLSTYSKDTALHVPRMAAVTANNGFIFVTLQRLKASYAAQDTSLVVVINSSTKAIVSTIPLHFKDPIAAHVLGNYWYISSIAGYGDLLGGVEKIDLAAKTNAGVVVTETNLASDVSDFIPTGDHTGYAAVYNSVNYTTRVKKVSY